MLCTRKTRRYDRREVYARSSFQVRVNQMKDKNRKMIALSADMVRIGKRMEAERRKLEKLVLAGTGYDSPEIKNALECYLREKAAWEEREQEYLALRDGK